MTGKLMIIVRRKQARNSNVESLAASFAGLGWYNKDKI